MYMLYYSEKREEILAEQPKLSMPEVAKICSEQYQKLSDKKKARYKKLYCLQYASFTKSLCQKYSFCCYTIYNISDINNGVTRCGGSTS